MCEWLLWNRFLHDWLKPHEPGISFNVAIFVFVLLTLLPSVICILWSNTCTNSLLCLLCNILSCCTSFAFLICLPCLLVCTHLCLVFCFLPPPPPSFLSFCLFLPLLNASASCACYMVELDRSWGRGGHVPPAGVWGPAPLHSLLYWACWGHRHRGRGGFI